jgi:hypothetical protein
MSARRRWLLIGGTVAAETIAVWMRTGRPGGRVVVRCRQGHLFTTIWIPGVSLKAARLGPWRYQRCPVGHHWSLVAPVRESGLSEEQRRTAAGHRDRSLP